MTTRPLSDLHELGLFNAEVEYVRLADSIVSSRSKGSFQISECSSCKGPKGLMLSCTINTPPGLVARDINLLLAVLWCRLWLVDQLETAPKHSGFLAAAAC